MAEQTDMIAAIRALVQGELAEMNTSLNGEVVSYSNGLATIKPLASKRFSDGDVLEFPNIPNVPIRWPSFNGGKCGIKGPIRAGDKVLIVFAQQALDGTDDERRFDLSDAYAIPSGNAQVAQATNNDDMIMWFGAAYIKLTADGRMEINAPGGTKTIAPNNEYTGNNLVAGFQTIAKYQTVAQYGTYGQYLTVTGTITGLSGMAITGIGASGKTASITGNLDIIGQVTANGKRIDESHKHSGVATGTAISGTVV